MSSRAHLIPLALLFLLASSSACRHPAPTTATTLVTPAPTTSLSHHPHPTHISINGSLFSSLDPVINLSSLDLSSDDCSSAFATPSLAHSLFLDHNAISDIDLGACWYTHSY